MTGDMQRNLFFCYMRGSGRNDAGVPLRLDEACAMFSRGMNYMITADNMRISGGSMGGCTLDGLGRVLQTKNTINGQGMLT